MARIRQCLPGLYAVDPAIDKRHAFSHARGKSNHFYVFECVLEPSIHPAPCDESAHPPTQVYSA
jgi:hypothetical protein